MTDFAYSFLTQNYKLISSICAFTAMYAAMIASCLLINTDPTDKVFSLNLMLLGSALGWAIGTLFAPYAGEAQEFAVFTKYISTFLSGYALAKLDPIVNRILSPDFALNVDKVSAFKVCIFTTCVMLSLMITFVFRRYAD